MRPRSLACAGSSLIRLVPLDRSQIDAMIERWYSALAANPSLQLAGDISALIGALQGLLHGNALLDELAASPLTLALWILVICRRPSITDSAGHSSSSAGRFAA